jgi:hypothetical protein
MFVSRILIVVAAAFAMSACAGYQAIKPEAATVIDNRISVAPQVMWAKPTGPGVRETVWTIDGFGLDELYFLLGRKPGDTMFAMSSSEKKDFPAVKAGMLPNDTMELMVNSLTRLNNNQVRASNLAPAPFGQPNAGFRFDLTFVNKDGLEMRGMALGRQQNDTVDMLLFIAPNEYYFGKLHDTVERLFQSVQPVAGS